MQTEILKEIARRYTEKYYPEFLHRFDRVWGLLRSANLKEFSIQKFQGTGGIEFADNVDGECVEWMRDLYIFGRLEVIHNILYNRTITKAELVRQLTRICNHLKLNPAIAKKKIEETADFILSLLEDDYPTVIKKKENIRLLVSKAGGECEELKKLSNEELDKEWNNLLKQYKIVIDDRYNLLYIDGTKMDIIISKSHIRLLSFFLRNKYRPLSFDRLYTVGWFHRLPADKEIRIENYPVMVRSAVSRLNRILRYYGTDLQILPERGFGYYCEGECSFCIVEYVHKP